MPGCVTVAVAAVIVIVMTWPPVSTVMVVGFDTGAAIWLTALVLPAIVTAAGAMSLVFVAAVAAVLLPVIAAMPVAFAPTFLTLVAPFSHHKCSWRSADLTSRNFFVARTTTPRCAANSVRCDQN